MYTIMMQNDKSLVTTVYAKLRQRETNVDMIRFLVPVTYEDFNLAEFTAVIKYVTPDHQSHCEQLVKEDILQKGYLDYRLDVDTDITAQFGRTELYITFLNVKQNEDGTSTEQVLHSGKTFIEVEENKEYIFIPDKSLEAVDQILLAMDAKINKLDDLASRFNATKADDIEIIDGDIYLVVTDPVTGVKTPIGDPISGGSHVWEEI